MTRETLPSFRDQMDELSLPSGDQTPWGVPILDTDGLRTITEEQPTGYAYLSRQRSLLEWLDPRTGGAAVILHQQDSSIPGLTSTPNPKSIFEVVNDSFTVGNAPRNNYVFVPALSRHLGLRVLSHSDIITVIQLPGIEDYGTAYATVNGQAPDIVVEETRAGLIDGKYFVDLAGDGQWPYDPHFFDAHAPAFVIGGPEHATALRGMARHVTSSSPEWLPHWVGGEIDTYADVYHQLRTAQTRLSRFRRTGQLGQLYDDNNSIDSILPENRAVMRRFNGVIAQYLGTALPESEQPDVVIPL